MDGRRTAHGFTLIELMITLAIIGLVAMFALPSVGRYRSQETAKANAERVAALLRTVHARAMKEGRPYLIVFNAKSDPNTLIARVYRDENLDSKPGPGITEFVDRLTVTWDAAGVVRPFDTTKDSQFSTVGQPPPSSATTPIGLGNLKGSTFPAYNVTPVGDSQTTLVAFNGRGIPFNYTTPGSLGTGTGGYYVSDSSGAVYAAVLGPLGEVRVRALNPSGAWQ